MNISKLIKKYRNGQQLTMVTAWDSMTASFIEKSEVDSILVGDSLAMTALGHESTLPVTLQDMQHHLKAVVRTASRPFIVCDIPFSAMQDPFKAGLTLMQHGAQSVKLEGVNSAIPSMVSTGIPVLGHLGLNPQHVHQLGGYKVYRHSQLIEQARQLQSYGCWGIVLEAVPSSLAKEVQAKVDIPLIGIGAGVLDGQVLVFSDLLGMATRYPKFCRTMANVGYEIESGLGQFTKEVQEKSFPSKKEEYE